MLWMNLRLGYLEKPLHFHNATTKSQLQTHLVYYGTYKAVVGFSVRSLSYWCFQPIFSAISIISNASSRRVRYGVLRFAIEDGVFDENLQYASEDKTLVNKMVKSGVIGYNDACVRAQISEPILLKEWIFHLCKMRSMWTVGCIFAELITKQTIIRGGFWLPQLHHIFKLLSTPEKELMPSSQGSSFAWSPLGTFDQFSPISSFNTLITLRYFPAPLEFQKRRASSNRGVPKFRILLLHELHGHFWRAVVVTAYSLFSFHHPYYKINRQIPIFKWFLNF